MITLKQTENTLSASEEAALILTDIFDGDLTTQQYALETLGISSDEEILDNEDALYEQYLPLRGDSSIQE
jgi:hypothetical protein